MTEVKSSMEASVRSNPTPMNLAKAGKIMSAITTLIKQCFSIQEESQMQKVNGAVDNINKSSKDDSDDHSSTKHIYVNPKSKT